MYRNFVARDFLSQFEDFQREIQGLFEFAPSIRGVGRGSYPALNVGSTPTSVEMYAFAPGMDPESIDVRVDRGVLTISGERQPVASDSRETEKSPGTATGSPTGGRSIRHVAERFTGPFRRVVSLPDDVDPEGITADYRDGVLHISLKRHAAAQPRRIAVQ